MTIHDRESAAKRVGKSVATIYRWERKYGLRFVGGRTTEAALLAADKLARTRVGRAPSPEGGRVTMIAVLNDIADERAVQTTKWGEQSHPDGTGPDLTLFGSPVTPGFATLRLLAQTSTDRRADAGTMTWADIAIEEVFEALAETDPIKLRAELIQSAAVLTQWAEAIDRRLAVPEAVAA